MVEAWNVSRGVQTVGETLTPDAVVSALQVTGSGRLAWIDTAASPDNELFVHDSRGMRAVNHGAIRASYLGRAGERIYSRKSGRLRSYTLR